MPWTFLILVADNAQIEGAHHFSHTNFSAFLFYSRPSLTMTAASLYYASQCKMLWLAWASRQVCGLLQDHIWCPSSPQCFINSLATFHIDAPRLFSLFMLSLEMTHQLCSWWTTQIDDLFQWIFHYFFFCRSLIGLNVGSQLKHKDGELHFPVMCAYFNYCYIIFFYCWSLLTVSNGSIGYCLDVTHWYFFPLQK